MANMAERADMPGSIRRRAVLNEESVHRRATAAIRLSGDISTKRPSGQE